MTSGHLRNYTTLTDATSLGFDKRVLLYLVFKATSLFFRNGHFSDPPKNDVTVAVNEDEIADSAARHSSSPGCS